MSERRRLMKSGGAKLIEDGLLLWYDGLNRGGTAGVWRPYINNTAYNDFFFAKVGTVNDMDGGMQIPWSETYRLGGLVDYNNPMKALSGNNMTIIIVASNMRRTTSYGSYIFNFTKWGSYGYSNRQAVGATNNIYNKGYYNAWYISTTVFPPTTINSAVFAFTSNGNSTTGNMEFDGINYKDTGFQPFKKDTEADCMILGAYCIDPGTNDYNLPNTYITKDKSNWANWSGTYNAVLLYDRVLSDSEISQVTAWLKNRYD